MVKMVEIEISMKLYRELKGYAKQEGIPINKFVEKLVRLAYKHEAKQACKY